MNATQFVFILYVWYYCLKSKIMSHCYNDDDDNDDNDDDVMATKGRHLMAAYGQQTLGNFHSSPNSLLRNKNMSILLPKMSTLFLQPRKTQSVCLLCGLNQILSERVRYLGVQVQQSGTLYVISEMHRGALQLCED